jgi:hypothetical protein
MRLISAYNFANNIFAKRWQRFQHQRSVSRNCDTNSSNISAKDSNNCSSFGNRGDGGGGGGGVSTAASVAATAAVASVGIG